MLIVRISYSSAKTAHNLDYSKIAISIYLIISYKTINLRHKFCICHSVMNVNQNYGGHKYGYSKMESHEGFNEHGERF